MVGHFWCTGLRASSVFVWRPIAITGNPSIWTV